MCPPVTYTRKILSLVFTKQKKEVLLENLYVTHKKLRGLSAKIPIGLLLGGSELGLSGVFILCRKGQTSNATFCFLELFCDCVTWLIVVHPIFSCPTTLPSSLPSHS